MHAYIVAVICSSVDEQLQSVGARCNVDFGFAVGRRDSEGAFDQSIKSQAKKAGKETLKYCTARIEVAW